MTESLPARRLLAAAGVATSVLAVTARAGASSTVLDSSSYLQNVNQARAARGLPGLTMRADLVSIAGAWSARMASAGVLAHNPALAGEVSNWDSVGENVGEGPSVADIGTAFWASPAHRDNLLDPSYRDVGIAYVQRSGLTWMTVVFRDPAGAAAAQPRPTSDVASPRLLRYGDVGGDVARLQQQLHVDADGIFGPVTLRAVMAFQRRNGLLVDGVVGPQTRSALSRQATTPD